MSLCNLSIALMMLLLFASAPARALDGAVPEQALKAVLFFKLPLFVYSGTNDKRAPISICTLGDAPLGSAVDKLPAALADGRRVDYKNVQSVSEVSECEFMFIGRSEAGRLDSLLRRLNGRRVVTVSDIDGFAQAGGMVEFTLRSDGSGIQILINRKAAQKQSIEFNAQLLRLAKLIDP